MKKEDKIKFISIFIVIGFTLAVFYHYMMAHYAGYNYYPFNTFLQDPNDKFSDYFHLYDSTKMLNPYASSFSIYFPFSFIILFLFTIFSAKIGFILFTSIFIIYLLIYVYRNLSTNDLIARLSQVFIFSAMTYPVLFLVDRGNIEAILFIFLSLFIYFYQKGKITEANIFLSFAIAMKLYPAVFLALYIADKKYRATLFVIIGTIALTLLSASLFEGGAIISMQSMVTDMIAANTKYCSSLRIGINHSVGLFAVGKIFLYGLFVLFPKLFPIAKIVDPSFNFGYRISFGKQAGALLENYYMIYPVIALALFVIASYLVLKTVKIFWQKVFIITASMLILPQISFDYKLIHLFIPLFLFINYDKKGHHDTIYAILLALLFIPKDYLILIGDISISVILNVLIIIMLVALFAINEVAKANDLGEKT